MPTPPVYQDYIQSFATPQRIHSKRTARNGLIPSASLETELANSMNFVSAIRGKCLSWATPIADVPAGSGSTRTRWRFFTHTSPFLRRLRAMVYMATADTTGGGGGGSNPSMSITVTNADESTTYGTATYSYGAFLGTPVDTPERFGHGEITIACPADTDVAIRVDDVNGGRVIAVAIQEEMLKLNSANGYIVPANVSIASPIYDARRQLLFETATAAWNRQAAHLCSWTVDDQSVPRLTAFNTSRNLIDNTSIAVSAATPGPTLDLRYCKTRSSTTVPCMLAVWGAMSTGADTGQVRIVDSSGSTIGSVLITSTTASWHTAVIDMPAALDKVDPQFRCITGGLGDSFTVGAVSLYQYA